MTYESEGSTSKEVWKTPQAVIDDQSGDCEDFAVLAAALIEAAITNDTNFTIDSTTYTHDGADNTTKWDSSRLQILVGNIGDEQTLNSTSRTIQGHAVLAVDTNDSLTWDWDDGSDIYIIDPYNSSSADRYSNYKTTNNFERIYSMANDRTIDYEDGKSALDLWGWNTGLFEIGNPVQVPKGPKDITATSFGIVDSMTYDVTYFFNQEGQRRTILETTRGDTNETTYETLSEKIMYGVESYEVLNPITGNIENILLNGNFDE